ncbi:GatB/YqeY domain-containing protein [Tessaracoccus sp. G1721]
MGATKDRLKRDLAAALRAKDEAAKTTIRMVMAAIGVEEVAGATARELSDAEELAVVAREMRKRRESAATYAEAGREDLAGRETSEAEFIAGYLPTPLTHQQLEQMVDEEVGRLGETPTMKHMGSLVKAVTARAEGRAEGKTIASLVRARLG